MYIIVVEKCWGKFFEIFLFLNENWPRNEFFWFAQKIWEKIMSQQKTLILNTFRKQVYTNIYHQIVYIDIICHTMFLFINFNQLILFPRRHKILRTLILNTFPQQVYTNLYHQIVYIDIICHITFYLLILTSWYSYLEDTKFKEH